jgi:hypothetical protein
LTSHQTPLSQFLSSSACVHPFYAWRLPRNDGISDDRNTQQDFR